jgi:hypothetical protein
MNKFLKAALLMVCATVLSACATTRIYVDPQYHKASYESLRQLAAPMLVKVTVNFQRDGKPLPTANGELRENVERTLRASRVFTPIENRKVPIELTIVANKIIDPDTIRAKGFGAGLTDAVTGPMIDDNYEFNFTYLSINNHQPVQAAYLHAIHIAPAASGVKATALNNAFAKVVEDVVLNFIKDLQDNGQV